MRKIVNIVIFAVAILACILTVIFAGSFNEKSKEKYYAISQTKESNPEIIAELETVTIEALPQFIAKYNAFLDSTDNLLKIEEQQQNIYYTYLIALEELDNEAEFTTFKENFPNFVKGLLVKSDNKDKFVSDFEAVSNYQAFEDFVPNVKKDYNITKQVYLQHHQNYKNLKYIVKIVTEIDAAKSVEKKKFDLTNLQEEINSFGNQVTLLNTVVYIIYILFFVAIALLIAFVIYHLFSNPKGSKGMLFGLIGLILIVIIGFFISPSELSQSAIKEQLSPNAFKWIGSGVLTTYCLLAVVILSIIVTEIIARIKNK